VTVDQEVTAVLERAWRGGFSVQSQFFRDNAIIVALCASEGYITTLMTQDTFGKTWRLTPEGTQKLFEYRLAASTKENSKCTKDQTPKS
jgi:hypothetical protein